MSGRWLIVSPLNNPNRVESSWADEQTLEGFGVKGEVGDVYQLDPDDEGSRYRIVGEITDTAADLLNSIVAMIDLVDMSRAASQELRFNIINGLVQDVAQAVTQAQKYQK